MKHKVVKSYDLKPIVPSGTPETGYYTRTTGEVEVYIDGVLKGIFPSKAAASDVGYICESRVPTDREKNMARDNLQWGIDAVNRSPKLVQAITDDWKDSSPDKDEPTKEDIGDMIKILMDAYISDLEDQVGPRLVWGNHRPFYPSAEEYKRIAPRLYGQLERLFQQKLGL